MLARALQVAKLTVKEVGADDLGGLAAELAYRFFLAIFPFFIFLGALGGLIATSFGISNPTDRIMTALGGSLPQDASSVLRGQLHAIIDSRNTGLLSVGIIGALWAASSGMNTLIKALNRTHDVQETRPLLKKYLLAVGLTVLAGSAVVIAFVVLVVGQVYGHQIADRAGLQGPFGLLVRYLRWPLVAGLMLVATAFLYWAAPNVKRPIRWLTPGAVMFVGAWLLATYLFGLYVSRFNSYNKTYGALGGVAALLVWFYMTAFILLLGEEVNAVIDQQLGPEAGEEGRRRSAGAMASGAAAARRRTDAAYGSHQGRGG